MCIWFFFIQKNRPYRLRRPHFTPHFPTIGRLITVGAPSFLSGFGATMMAVAVNSLLVAGGGAIALAAHAVVSRIQTFLIMPQTGISQGMAPIVGYNWGSQRFDRVDRTFRLSVAAVLALSVLGAGLVAVFSSGIIGFFLPAGPESDIAATALLIVCVGAVFSGRVPVISTYFQSVGQPAPAYVLSVGTLLAVKIPLVMLAGNHGPYWVWWSVAIGEVISAVIAVLVLLRMLRRNKTSQHVHSEIPQFR